MAVPPGSSTPALRVGSGRGPTPRTAPRGARSGRVRHATGLTCLNRSDHRDRGPPKPLPTSAVSPEYPSRLACRPPAEREVLPHVRPAVEPKIEARENLASACLSSAYVNSMWSD